MYRVKCRKCERELQPTNWFPPEGLDPTMKKFICESCGVPGYQVMTESEIKNFEKRLEV